MKCIDGHTLCVFTDVHVVLKYPVFKICICNTVHTFQFKCLKLKINKNADMWNDIHTNFSD